MNKDHTATVTVLVIGLSALPAQVMTLSMQEAVAAALDRNFSIRVERFEPQVAREVTRAAMGDFDPVVESEYQYQRDEWSRYAGDEEFATFRFGVGSTLPWGTQWQARVETEDRTTPFDYQTGGFYDSISTFAGIVVTQPVLRGFGFNSAYANVRIARESANASWEVFRARVMDTVEETVSAYQNLYFAQESLRIAERNRDLARQLLKDNQKRVETGALAPLDLVQAESEAALREVSVISSRAALRQARNALKGLIWDNPDSVLNLELEIQPPAEPEYFEPRAGRDFNLALENRPEYLAAAHGLNIRELELRKTRRDALPQLDIVGSAGRRGLDSRLGDSLDEAFGDGDPSYSIGAIFSLPFPNRSRTSEKTRAYLRRNQAEVNLQKLEQDIRLELDDAGTQVTADWERIKAARTARELAEKSLQAEEKKLQAGTSTTFVVLRLQGDLATAEIREINALAEYSVTLARYNRVCGRILDIYHISLE